MKVFIALFIVWAHTLNLLAAEKISLQLQWLDQFQFAGYYVAIEKGFYEEAGLDVTLKPYRTDLNVVDEVVEGRAEYGIGRSSLMIDHTQGKPVIAMAAIFQSSPMMLLVLADSGIHETKDLIGKRIMLTNDVASTVSLRAMLNTVGVTMNDIVVQTHSFDVRSLIEGKTDALASYTSNEPFVLKELGIKTYMLHPKDYGFDFYSDILFTSDKELQGYPDRVKAFYDASLKGWQYAFDHIDETARLIINKYNGQKKSYESLVYEGEALKKLAFATTGTLGNIDRKRLNVIAQAYQVMGLIKNGAVLDHFIYQRDKIQLTPDEKAWLKAHPVIRVGIDREFRPIEYLDENGKYAGISASYLKAISEKLGINFDIISDRDWNDLKEGVRMRTVDMLSAALKTPERKKYMRFSDPYLSLTKVIIADSKVSYLKGLSELDGKKMAIIKGFAVSELLARDYPGIEQIEVADMQEALKKVAYGEAFAFIGVLTATSYYIDKLRLSNLKVVGQTSYFDDLRFAVRSDWPQWQGILQKALDAIPQQKREAIYKQSVPIVYEHHFDYSLLWKILFLIMIIIILILYRYIKLDKLVKVRTKELEMLNLSLKGQIDEAVAKDRIKERMMIQQSKMASIGEMIEAIAHQWRQPLNILALELSNMDLKRQLGSLSDEELQKVTESSHTQIAYMSQTIDDFRNFFKMDKEKELVSLQAIVNDVAMLSTGVLKSKNITLTVAIDSNILIHIFANELKQVILNLLNNAKDAIILKDVQVREIRIDAKIVGTDCLVGIEDTGGGIEEPIIDKIFEPYFTTKFESQGTGIGLYMSKMIIENNLSGHLSVSNTDQGARFEILLHHVQSVD